MLNYISLVRIKSFCIKNLFNMVGAQNWNLSTATFSKIPTTRHFWRGYIRLSPNGFSSVCIKSKCFCRLLWLFYQWVLSLIQPQRYLFWSIFINQILRMRLLETSVLRDATIPSTGERFRLSFTSLRKVLNDCILKESYFQCTNCNTL